jgi:hypothetical protein
MDTSKRLVCVNQHIKDDARYVLINALLTASETPTKSTNGEQRINAVVDALVQFTVAYDAE